ncbi:MAG: sulfotransferase [Vicinamibacteria bacterium]|nr:sulfotransferase [Vicinamibacteria bacterium]
MNPPIVVLGMHRSGTTLVVRCLERLGVHMGWRQDENAESLLFLRLNEWLLLQAGGNWEHPGPVRELLAAPEVRELALQHVRDTLAGPRSLAHAGPRAFLAGERGFGRSGPWGFKDPRTLATLPLWLEVFPGARLLHVRRHGIDVARSLVTRHPHAVAAGQAAFARRRRRYAWLRPRWPLIESVRCRAFPEAFALWEEYCALAEQHLAGVGNPLVEIRFEDLAADPARVLGAVAAWAGLQPEAGALAAAAALVKPQRARAFASAADGAALERELGPRLARFGY